MSVGKCGESCQVGVAVGCRERCRVSVEGVG